MAPAEHLPGRHRDCRLIPTSWYPPDWAHRPPGMTWDDWQVWAPFLKDRGPAWSDFTYNVRLSIGGTSQPGATAADQKQWNDLTAKRIDAIGRIGDRYTLFEARRIAGWSAIAQLEGYRLLWPLNLPEWNLDRSILITGRIDAAVEALAGKNNIEVIVVQELQVPA